MINCLLDRNWKICKDDDGRRDEICKIKSILDKNEYPREVIEREEAKFIKRKEINETEGNRLRTEEASSRRICVSIEKAR